MITESALRRLAPHARPEYISAIVDGAEHYAKWDCDNPHRFAACLATWLHECRRLEIVRESMTYTTPSRLMAVWPKRFPTLAKAMRFVRNPVDLAEEVYGGRGGNEKDGIGDGDGFAYRGGGLMQTTFPENYEAAGEAIGVDLLGHPELIEDAEISLQAALWEASKFWKYADLGEAGFKSFSNGINRGDALSKYDPIGWGDRMACYQDVLDELAITNVTERMLVKGMRGEQVEMLQHRLTELGYSLGEVDGVFGGFTVSAVRDFQDENWLTIDGKVGPRTRAVLYSTAAIPRPISEARATATAQDLAAAGSVTMGKALGLMNVARLAGGVSVGGGVFKAVEIGAPAAVGIDVIGEATKALGELQEMQTLLIGFSKVGEIMLSNWWLAGGLVAYGLYRWGYRIGLSRLISHRRGENLAH